MKQKSRTKLTSREVEIVRLIAEGKTNKEIGKDLHISPAVVRNYISSILRRTKLDNRVQVAVCFTKHVYSSCIEDISDMIRPYGTYYCDEVINQANKYVMEKMI